MTISTRKRVETFMRTVDEPLDALDIAYRTRIRFLLVWNALRELEGEGVVVSTVSAGPRRVWSISNTVVV